jgi:hypothetical protein
VTLASRDGRKMEVMCERDGVSSVGVTPVNCEAELRVTCYLTGGIQGAKTDSRAKFGKETIAGAQRRPQWAPHYSAQADSGRAQDTQALLRLGSGSAQALLRLAQACSGLLRLCSGSAQAQLRHAHRRLRYAHPQLRLKQQLLTSAD